MVAYRRSIITRAKFVYQQRFAPSFAYMHRDGDDRKRQCPLDDVPKNSGLGHCCWLRSGIHTLPEGRALFQDRRGLQFVLPTMMMGSISGRNMSMATVGEESANKINYMSDVAEVLTDKAVEAVASQAPAVNEVAIAAADSYFPVAALQYLVDYVHSFTGLNWWASIAVTTLLIQGITVPLVINHLKATSKLTLIRPRLQEIQEEISNQGMNPTAMAEGKEQMEKLFKEYGVNPWIQLMGLLFQGPIFISFFLAISNMVEKVPSFKGGGAFWFTDLTTPDSMYIFPVLTALTFWITVELLMKETSLSQYNTQEGLEGNPIAGKMKNIFRGLAALTVPITAGFPKAIFFYLVTFNLFSLVFGLVLKKPEVKKLLGVPTIKGEQPPPGSSSPKPPPSFFEAIKKFAEATQRPPSPVEPSKPLNQQISSSSVLSERIKSLEKEVKGRKKGKKR